MRTNYGHLKLNTTLIKWRTWNQFPPSDGTYDCYYATLAQLLDIKCENATLVFITGLAICLILSISVVSFYFWKCRYDKKIKHSARIMKNFGIDLLCPKDNQNTLDKWEIPKNNVIFNRRLGEGAFGTVYGGEAQISSETWTAIAAKTLKVGASTEARLDFLCEAEAMKRFDHNNIVKLLAVCLQSEPIYTIMEYMLYGDLKTFLLARRHMVNEQLSEDSDISAKQLTSYAIDIARGLAYLAQQRYVHRDLACRNCLVSAERTIKIGDFGMARSTYESDYYRFNRRGMLPVRWMAPEALALGLFTPASDIWSFGVVLYEIISFGSYPYQGLTNSQVLEHVKSGKTIDIPCGTKAPLQGFIKACWSLDVKQRPSAAEIVDYIACYPNLLMPCLDFPGSAVVFPEAESDDLELELELLLKMYENPRNEKENTLEPFIAAEKRPIAADKRIADLISKIEMQKYTEMYIPSDSSHSGADSITPTTPNGYSIMSPLLTPTRSNHSESSDYSLVLENQTLFNASQ